jgi:hypothetical protein
VPSTEIVLCDGLQNITGPKIFSGMITFSNLIDGGPTEYLLSVDDNGQLHRSIRLDRITYSGGSGGGGSGTATSIGTDNGDLVLVSGGSSVALLSSEHGMIAKSNIYLIASINQANVNVSVLDYIIQWGYELIGSSALFDGSKYTCQVSGVYHICVGISATIQATASHSLAIYKENSGVITKLNAYVPFQRQFSLTISTHQYLNLGEKLFVKYNVTEAPAFLLTGSNFSVCFMNS